MTPQDLSNEVLSEIERDKIVQFCADPVLSGAVKKYILAVLYKQGVVGAGQTHNARINFALNLAWPATTPNGMPRSDEELGQSLRAMTYGIQLIESGFREMEEMRKPEVVEAETVNPSE